MSPLSIVPDLVVSLVSDPVGHRAVLLYLFAILYLLVEGFLGPLSSIGQQTQKGLPFPLLLLLFNK